MTLVTVRNSLLAIKGITLKLQKRDLGVLEAYSMVDEVEKHLQLFRNNISEDHKEWYEEAVALGQKIGAEPQLPRITA